MIEISRRLGGKGVVSRLNFAEWFGQIIAEKRPVAVVRHGDSEDAVLRASRENAESMSLARRKLRKMCGLQLPTEEILDIRELLTYAFDAADVLGILPGRKAALPGRKAASKVENGLSEIYAERAVSGDRKPALLASCLLHHEIFDLLPQLLAGRRVSVISCRDLKPVLESEWDLDDVAVYQVPSHTGMRHVDGPYEAALHDVPIWPDVHSRVREEAKVREHGEIFLVGAGVFGKDFCIHIREKGGIALDLGSALDRAVGKITRGTRLAVLRLHRQGMSVGEIAARMEATYAAEVDCEKIRELLDAPSPHSTANPFEVHWMLASKDVSPPSQGPLPS